MSRAIREQFVPRFALRREEAAASIGVSPTKFDQMVQDGRMPKPHKIDALARWDTDELWESWVALRDGCLHQNPLDDKVL